MNWCSIRPLSSQALSSLLASRGITDFSVCNRTIANASVVVAYSIDKYEVERRSLFENSTDAEPDLLRALSSMPLAIPLPVQFFDLELWPALMTADPCLVDMGEEGFTRISRPPCSVHAMLITGSTWKSVAGVLSTLMSVAPCLVQPESEEAVEEFSFSASFFGFGLVLDDAVLMDPPVSCGSGSDWRSWQFAEDLFRCHQAQTSRGFGAAKLG